MIVFVIVMRDRDRARQMQVLGMFERAHLEEAGERSKVASTLIIHSLDNMRAEKAKE